MTKMKTYILTYYRGYDKGEKLVSAASIGNLRARIAAYLLSKNRDVRITDIKAEELTADGRKVLGTMKLDYDKGYGTPNYGKPVWIVRKNGQSVWYHVDRKTGNIRK